jgi:uncharacterized membrane protein
MNSNVVKRIAQTAGNTAQNVAQKAAAFAGRPVVVGLTGLVLAGGANAQVATIDTTDIVSTISGGVTAISAIGVAVISLVVVIKLYKWVQRVL